MSDQPVSPRPILVTGGAGFIGSAVIRLLIAETQRRVVNVDCLGYASSLEAVGEAGKSNRHVLEELDLRNRVDVEAVIGKHRPAAVVHLAAETHVDRSIDNPAPFVESNILGSFNLLEAARGYWRRLPEPERQAFRFHHVSTDEVFGSMETGRFTETTPYAPRSPYSASKAASDHLVRAWHATYGLPTLITNCSNNFGPCQFPEKLIPLMILNALEEQPLPVYGDGGNVRDWLFVEDHARALLTVLQQGRVGQTYNIGGNAERSNLQVVQAICRALDAAQPRRNGRPYDELIEFVTDRPGHDFRYAMDFGKLHRELGWKPTETFESALQHTVGWYLANRAWCEQIQQRGYRRKRLGLGSRA